ncbi:MAG: Fe-S cluster assembly sulfur transfer protein SufU [Bdellovibrionales bacterium]
MDLTQARAILIDHARNPRNHLKELLGVDAKQGECRNPLCGDFVRVAITQENSRIQDISMEVQGCTICTASASLMSENVRGLLESEAQELRRAFSDILVTAEHHEWPPELKAFHAFSHLRVNPARIPCALIPWYALKQALNL